jgi:hypothetical protein
MSSCTFQNWRPVFRYCYPTMDFSITSVTVGSSNVSSTHRAKDFERNFEVTGPPPRGSKHPSLGFDPANLGEVNEGLLELYEPQDVLVRSIRVYQRRADQINLRPSEIEGLVAARLVEMARIIGPQIEVPEVKCAIICWKRPTGKPKMSLPAAFLPGTLSRENEFYDLSPPHPRDPARVCWFKFEV